MLRVALTGGIASGKSTVADLFQSLGVPVIRTDELARRVVEPGSRGLAAVRQAFGPGIIDDKSGRLDRAALRARIFADKGERNRLEKILHPLIHAELEADLAHLPPGTPYAIIEIPLLVETGSADHYDRVLVVDCDEQTQRQRLAARDGATDADTQQALQSQASRPARLAIADDVIDNTDADIADLRRNVERLHNHYLDLVRAGND